MANKLSRTIIIHCTTFNPDAHAFTNLQLSKSSDDNRINHRPCRRIEQRPVALLAAPVQFNRQYNRVITILQFTDH